MVVEDGNATRITPLPPEHWSELQTEVMRDLIDRDGNVPNVIATFVRNPELCRAWMMLSRQLLHYGSLPSRDREIIILRIAWRTASVYEWRQHAWRVDEQALEHLSTASTFAFWNDVERDLIAAVDEYCRTGAIGRTNWLLLAQHYDEQLLLEVVFLCSIYRALASILEILGVEPDTDAPPLPPLE